MNEARSRSLFASLILFAAVAFGIGTTAWSEATAQELEWATSAGGTKHDLGRSITTDSLGNSYVTGHFGGRATFGAGEDNETVLTSLGSDDLFVAKYSPDGALLWVTSAGGTGRDDGGGIATDPEGNSYVTGLFGGMATFGAGEENETVLVAVGGTDLFVAKYSSDGALLWVKSAGGGTDEDQGTGIATDPDGNSYVTGWFKNDATFGAGEENETVVSTGSRCSPLIGSCYGLVVAKYDPDGALLWVTSAAAGNRDFVVGFSIAADPFGNSYVTGQFQGLATFGAGEDNETVLTGVESGVAGVGSDDLFVAKYSPDGALLWATSAGGTAGDGGAGIATDPQGNSYVSGSFGGTATFGAGEENDTVLTAVGGTDLLVAKYAPDGTLLWVTSAGGTGFENGAGIATDPQGNSYLTGSFFPGPATFGAGEENETVLTGAGLGSDTLFVAKYTPEGTLAWAKSTDATIRIQGFGIASDGLGNSYVTGIFGGTATFGAGEYNETVITATDPSPPLDPRGSHVDIFVAKFGGAGAAEDRDADGVPDEVDFCPATVLPEAVPTTGRLLPNHFALTGDGPGQTFTSGRGQTRASFTIFDTRGCSCEQIIDYLSLGEGHRRNGCSIGAMRRFIAELNASPG